MTTTCKQNVSTLKVVDGSIVTFECIAKVPNDIAHTLILEFEYSLPSGLSYIEKEDFVTTSYSVDSGITYNNITPDVCSFYNNTLYLILDEPLPISTYYEHILIKVNFKVLVKDRSALSSTLGKGIFYGYYYHPMVISDISDQSINFDEYTIEKYNFMVTGYSLNIHDNFCCSNLKSSTSYPINCYDYDKLKKIFFASFSFNALNSNYSYDGENDPSKDTAQYTITIKPTAGLKFPTSKEDLEKIKVSIASDFLCHGTLIKTINAYIDNKNLVIEILHIDTIVNTDKDCTANNNILVSIPYEIGNCTLSPFFIQGSIRLDDIHLGKNLAFLDKFCLYINIESSELTGINQQNLLC